MGEGSLVFSEERGFPSVGTGEGKEKGNAHLIPSLSWEGLESDWHPDPERSTASFVVRFATFQL